MYRFFSITWIALILLCIPEASTRQSVFSALNSHSTEFQKYIDPVLDELSIVWIRQPNSFFEAMCLLSQSIPLRIFVEKNRLYVLPPSLSQKAENPGFRATLILPKEQLILNRLNATKGRFARLELTWSFTPSAVWIEATAQKEWFINTLNQDFLALASLLSQTDPPLKIEFQMQDWFRLQKEMLYHQTTGIFPNLKSDNNEHFNRNRQMGVLSDTPP